MTRNPLMATIVLTGTLSLAMPAQQSQQPTTPPAPAAQSSDGITMAMMPITQEQIAACRAQASDQLAKEQETLGKREGKQDANKMKQGGITATAGAVTTVLGRRGGWWGGNHSGDATAGATANTQRTERNSDNVASTTATSQVTGNKAYDDCVDGIKGPEYAYFRTTGRIPAPGQVVATTGQPAAANPPPPPVRKDPYTAIDDKTGILELEGADGKSVGVEVTKSGANLYMDKAGNKYLVRDDKSILTIPSAGKEQHR